MRVGILGGGQLAQMLTQAAVSLGLDTAIYDTAPDTPASRLTHHNGVGAWDDLAALRDFAAACDVLTLENEFVRAEPLIALADEGVSIHPSGRTLAKIQDKLIQKQTLIAAGLPVPPFEPVASVADAAHAGATFGYPIVLKKRYGGYDGYGNATVLRHSEVAEAYARLSATGAALMAESFVSFARELAVMVVRGYDGETRAYPVVETVQRNHICHIVRAPAGIPRHVAALAQEIAVRAVQAFGGVGIFGVELFELLDGQIVLNEIAPRPHNSGHYTIEACVTSQFENLLRAVLGWPLGDVTQLRPAVMVNLLGTRAGETSAADIAPALGVLDAHIHLYGKREGRVGRKMGHITALGATVADAERIAVRAASLCTL
ncbi:MAG: 5-(carboxyamino)imidazole ribonucleotide synthase [Chloroflexi bacterium]|nr:5-(carboxyamino)imidazole ribonucleotide synthase [Chloroflexota bacterium]MBV6436542.1 N5-carboxyaminoimidazole ribonucleotide synthase [Anaerolineae bacterium]MDL1917023.1 5-(carboxyamino)imidazole ribonucleotide synthase [Anaerolineae bacterium CFX4]RIK18929.1 MAG: 5-(carboxyamino)imidazole ribonucleotide synthase [Chloroflexota bacterium]